MMFLLMNKMLDQGTIHCDKYIYFAMYGPLMLNEKYKLN
jgi:hypothetical protein